ncbi:hypothetical protein UFOVP398_34 [uncultured Caudovirales phage]|uniref:Uncharacterized protein n=1 Tax=uncultured Caudovirales phage TaxID=2100421 RepID=A0A6J5M9H5_9CAUD|nr:hypothetical protein UFOVP398_34 [uncultured Caudovirales phage]
MPAIHIIDPAMHVDIDDAINEAIEESGNYAECKITGGVLYSPYSDNDAPICDHIQAARKIAQKMATDYSVISREGNGRVVASCSGSTSRPDNYDADAYETTRSGAYTTGNYVVLYSLPGMAPSFYCECDTWADARKALRNSAHYSTAIETDAAQEVR